MYKKLWGVALAGMTVAGLVAAQAYAANLRCDLKAMSFPTVGKTSTEKVTCQHIVGARAPSTATFVAKTDAAGAKTLSVSMGCCGTSATILGLKADGSAVPGCQVSATEGGSASVSCNAAVKWSGAVDYFE